MRTYGGAAIIGLALIDAPPPPPPPLRSDRSRPTAPPLLGSSSGSDSSRACPSAVGSMPWRLGHWPSVSTIALLLTQLNSLLNCNHKQSLRHIPSHQKGGSSGGVIPIKLWWGLLLVLTENTSSPSASVTIDPACFANRSVVKISTSSPCKRKQSLSETSPEIKPRLGLRVFVPAACPVPIRTSNRSETSRGYPGEDCSW